MATQLTAATLATLKPKRGADGKPVRTEKADGKCAGLYLVIQPSGEKSWAVRFRSPVERAADGQGKPRKLTLGPLANGAGTPNGEPEIGKPLTLAQARVLATATLDMVQRKIDPTHLHAERKAQEKAKALKDGDAANLVENAFAAMLRRYPLKKGKKPVTESTVRQTATLLGFKRDKNGDWILSGNGVAKYWKGRQLRDVAKRASAITILETIGDNSGPVASNRTLAALKLFGKWAVRRELLDSNPFADIDALYPEQERERALSDDEIVALWKAGDAEGYPYGTALQLQLVTGQRPGEPRAAPWIEFNLKERDWTLPPGRLEGKFQKQRTKNSREHFVPLNDLAVAIIETLPRRGDYLFMTKGAYDDRGKRLPPQVIQKQSRVQRRIYEKFFRELGQKVPEDRHDPRHWVPHDLRHTCFTGLQRLGFSDDIADRVTNHSPRGMAKTYGHYDFAVEKEEALWAWGAHIEKLLTRAGVALPAPLQTEQKSADVIRLPKKRAGAGR